MIMKAIKSIIRKKAHAQAEQADEFFSHLVAHTSLLLVVAQVFRLTDQEQ